MRPRLLAILVACVLAPAIPPAPAPIVATGWPKIGTSGATVAVLVVDDQGRETPLVAAPTGLVASAPGIDPTPLDQPIWDPKLAYAVYPIPPPLQGQPLHLSAPDGWAKAKAGTLGPLEADATPGGYLPPEDPSLKARLKLGWNLARPSTYLPYYADSYLNGGFNATLAAPPNGQYPARYYLAWQGIANPGDPLGYVTCPIEGDWTVLWDGPWDAGPTVDTWSTRSPASVGLALVAEVRSPTDRGHRRTYHVAGDPARRRSPDVFLLFPKPGAVNVHAYRPGLDPAMPPRFDPDLLAKLGSPGVLRTMDTLFTNHSNLSRADDFLAGEIPAGMGRPLGGHVVSIAAAPNPQRTYQGKPYNAYDQATPAVLEFDSPHGCVPGHHLALSASAGQAGPTGDGKLPTVGGGFATLKAGADLVVGEVPDPTHLVIALPGAGASTLAGAWPADFTFGAATSNRLMPLRDLSDLANTVGSDLWFCSPLLLDDEGNRRVATLFAESLGPGRRVFVEASNEVWNTGFRQNQQAALLGRLCEPMLPPEQWLATRATQVHAIWRDAFKAAGRPEADVIRVVGTQAGNPAVTASIVGRIKALGGSFDLLALAPYLSNGPQRADLAPVYDTLSTGQLLDLLELFLLHKDFGPVYAQHRAALDKAGFAEVGFANYEGGLENSLPQSNADRPTKARRAIALANDPRMGPILRAYLEQFAELGVTVHCYYELSGTLYQPANGFPYLWPAFVDFGQGDDASPAGRALHRWMRGEGIGQVTPAD